MKEKHKHEFTVQGVDAEWLFLGCSGCHASKQVLFTKANYRKYAVEPYRKNPEMFNAYAKECIEYFMKNNQIIIATH